jgi:hypothetical protein
MIAARWRYWEPLEVIASLQRSIPRLVYMVQSRQRHDAAARYCRACGLSWPVIIRNSLDDPSMPEDARRTAVSQAQERHRIHMTQSKFAVNARLPTAARRR